MLLPSTVVYSCRENCDLFEVSISGYNMLVPSRAEANEKK